MLTILLALLAAGRPLLNFPVKSAILAISNSLIPTISSS